MSTNVKIKNKADKENVRWTTSTTETFLAVLKAKGKHVLEKPTAQSFYKKILDEHPDIFVGGYTWTVMRDKFRYLKTKFKKAIDWRKNTGAGLLEDDPSFSIRDAILAMCPEFDILEDLLGEKCGVQMTVFSDSELEKLDLDMFMTQNIDIHSLSPDVGVSSSTEAEALSADPNHTSTTPEEPKIVLLAVTPDTPTCKRKLMEGKSVRKTTSLGKANSSVEMISQMQSQKQNYLDNKLEWEKTVYYSEQEIKKSKIELENKRIDSEVQMKEKELQVKLEIEKTRLEYEFKLKEMELKYKHQSQKNGDSTGAD